MVIELILVFAVTVCLTLIAELKTRTKEISHILAFVSNYGILSGAFISIIQLLITISKYEQLIVSKVLVEETSIIKFVLMIEYGSDWIKAFKDKDLEDYENMRRKLVGREVLEFKDDHLLWYAVFVK